MKTISKSRTLNKASELIDGLISNDLLFKDVDKRMVLKDLSEVFNSCMSAEQVELSGNTVQDTLKGILVGYAASDIFDDFTAIPRAAIRELRKGAPGSEITCLAGSQSPLLHIENAVSTTAKP